MGRIWRLKKFILKKGESIDDVSWGTYVAYDDVVDVEGDYACNGINEEEIVGIIVKIAIDKVECSQELKRNIQTMEMRRKDEKLTRGTTCSLVYSDDTIELKEGK